MVHRLRAHRWLGVINVAVLLMPVLAAVTVQATRIRVSQESRAGAGDFDRHVLGHIGPMKAEAGVDQAYAYNRWNRFSFNGPRPVLRANVSHLFFVAAREGLTLFVVHDAVDNPDGGSAAMRIRVSGNRNNTRLLLRDDAFSESDSYDVGRNGTDFYAWHNWYACCTDGLVLGPLAGQWKVYVQFIGDEGASGQAFVDGLSRWEALSIKGRIRLELERGRRVLLEPMGSFALKQRLGERDFTTHLRR